MREGPPDFPPRFDRRQEVCSWVSFSSQGLSDLGDLSPSPPPPCCGLGLTLARTYAYLLAFSGSRPVSIEGVSPPCSSCPSFGLARCTCSSTRGFACVVLGRECCLIVHVGVCMFLFSPPPARHRCLWKFAFSLSRTCSRTSWLTLPTSRRCCCSRRFLFSWCADSWDFRPHQLWEEC